MKRLILIAFCCFLFSSAYAQPLLVLPKKENVDLVDLVKKVNSSKTQCPLSPARIPEELRYACSDLAKLACKPGTFSDGTGVSYSKEAIEEKVKQIKQKMEKGIKEGVVAALLNPESKFNYLRDLMTSVTSQDGTPACLSKNAFDKKKCFENISEQLAARITKHEFSYHGYGVIYGDEAARIDFEKFEALTNNIVFTSIIDPIKKRTAAELSQDTENKRVKEVVFPRVKVLLIEKISEMVKDEKVKTKLINKINNISYNGNDCPGVTNGLNVGFVKNAYYSSVSQEFKFCNGLLLQSSSEFMLASIIGHELSHSIDPCSIAKPQGMGFDYSKPADQKKCENEFPFQNIIQCLRTKNSIGASRAEWAKPPQGAYQNSSTLDAFGAPPMNESPFCKDDQVGEGFSDWMASEILPDYMNRYHAGLNLNQKINGYSNAFRTICEPDQAKVPFQDGFDVHPATRERINRIFLANPKIFEAIGCKAEDKSKENMVNYCEVGKPVVGETYQKEREEVAAKNAAQSYHPNIKIKPSEGEQK